jgi:hypothetical protein
VFIPLFTDDIVQAVEDLISSYPTTSNVIFLFQLRRYLSLYNSLSEWLPRLDLLLALRPQARNKFPQRSFN